MEMMSPKANIYESIPTSTIPTNASDSHGNETGTFYSMNAGLDWRNPTGQRTASQLFNFPLSFPSTPRVSIGLTNVNVEDIAGGNTVGLSVYADAISGDGFMLNL